MPGVPLFALVDKALGGHLAERLRAARENGDSFQDIARDLHGDGVPISGETVRKWCRELDIDTAKAS